MAGPGPPRYGFEKADRRVSCCCYFLRLGRAFRPWVHQAVQLLSLAGQGVGQRPRVGQTAGPPARHRLQRAGQRIRDLRRPGSVAAGVDRLGPAQLQAFFDRWMAHIPTPLGATDGAGGYRWELSMRQIEVSRTLVLDQPRRARAFFAVLVADNLGIGRPDEVSLIFDRRIHSDTDTGFATRVVTRGVDVTVNCFYKHSRIKQYLKEGRALRIETVINSPTDLGVGRRLCHLDELQAKARAANRRLLDTERAGQGCVLASPAFARVAQPSGEAGCRTGALRFGDPRVMALAGALCAVLVGVVGFTHRSLRAQVAALLGTAYSTGPDELRPDPASPQGPHPTPARHQPPTGSASRCSTPSSTTDSWSRCWPPTPHLPHRNCARRLASSTARSPTTSARPGWRLPEHFGETPKSQPPRSATPLPRLRSEPVAPTGQFGLRAGDG
jgi:hypothetical protein